VSGRTSPTGLTLREAIERHGDPALRRAWEDASKELNDAGGATRIISVSFWESESEERSVKHRHNLMARQARAERAYISDFWSKLSTGELIAWGRKGTPEVSSNRIDAAFKYLTPDFNADIIRGPNDLTIYDVRITHRDEAGGREAVVAAVPRHRIDQAIKQRLTDWKPEVGPPPTKSQVFKEVTQLLGPFSRREFDLRWAEHAPHQWKKPGPRKKRPPAS